MITDIHTMQHVRELFSAYQAFQHEIISCNTSQPKINIVITNNRTLSTTVSVAYSKLGLYSKFQKYFIFHIFSYTRRLSHYPSTLDYSDTSVPSFRCLLQIADSAPNPILFGVSRNQWRNEHRAPNGR